MNYFQTSRRNAAVSNRLSVPRLCVYIAMLIFAGVAGLQAQTPSIQTSVSSLSGFIQTNTIPCPLQTYVVSSPFITADVVVTAPAGFEISVDQVNWFAPPNTITVSQTGSLILPTTISVRLNTATLGAYAGNIVNSATDAPTVYVAVSGNRYAKSPTTTALVSNLNPSLFGQSVTLTATVTPLLSGTPTGTVTFYDGATALGTVTLNLAASASLSTSTLAFGSHNLTAVYNEDASFGTSTSSIVAQLVRGTTTTAIVSNNNPSVSGQSVTFTATVSSAFAGVPTGSVTFYDGATSLGSVVVSGAGTAALSTSALTPGVHSITAAYGGDASFAGSASSVLSQTVKATTTTAILSNHNPSVSGQLVTLTANVSSTTAGTITGTVSFFDGGTPLGSPVALSGGSAAYTASYNTSTSPHSFTATFNGDANYASSTSSALNQVINKAGATPVITANHNPSSNGQSVMFTGTVNPVSPGTGTPTGSIIFTMDGTPSGPVVLVGGIASMTTSSLAVGTHVITATYSGDVEFNAGASGAYADTVNPTITATAALHGSISPSGAVVVTYGSNPVFAITPAIGYQVDSLFIDGVAQAGAETYTFFNVTINHTISATFIVKTFKVTVTAGPNGSANPTGIVTVLRADNLVLNFTAAAHYHVADVLLDGVSVGAGASYTLRNVLADHSINVTFTIDTYTITATAGQDGNINPLGSVVVDYGSDRTFTITPDAHCVVDSVVVDGVSIGAVSSYTFHLVSAAHAITAYFKLSAIYGARYRTFPYDSLIAKKAVLKKPVTEYWEFTVRNTLSTDLTEVNVAFKNDVKEIISLTGSFTAVGLKKIWQFTGGVLHPLESLVIKGRSLKPRAQQIAKLFLGPVVRIPAAKAILPDKQWPELPLPNAASVRDLAFAQAGFATAPWIIGVAVQPESIKFYGWVALKKSRDMYKSLFDKTKHLLIGNGFDLIGVRPFIKAQPSLSPSKHNNKTFADLLSFKFNILLSQLGIVTRGFGELRFNQSSSHFDGMLLRDIATAGDSMMTYHDKYIGDPGIYLSLDSLLCGLNGAFSAPMDTISWLDSLRLRGAARLQDIPYLTPSGAAPIVLEPQPGSDVLADAGVPSELRLEQNYPNPFNPTTSVDYSIPFDAHVTLKVYNVLGQVAATLVDEMQLEGDNSVEFNASNLPSGVYFYRLTAGGYTETRKMILMK